MRIKISSLLSILISITIIIVSFFSCKKSNSQQADHFFTWTFRDSTYNATIDTAFRSGLSDIPVIVGGFGKKLLYAIPKVMISLKSFDKGTYTLGYSDGNTLIYVGKDSIEGDGNNGTVTITASTSNYISGTFNAKVAVSGGSHPLTGTFTNTPVLY